MKANPEGSAVVSWLDRDDMAFGRVKVHVLREQKLWKCWWHIWTRQFNSGELRYADRLSLLKHPWIQSRASNSLIVCALRHLRSLPGSQQDHITTHFMRNQGHYRSHQVKFR